MEEKVSVVIATYNGELYIKKQLESIINQLTPNSEIIISDDGSIDKTIEIIKQYNHPGIKLLSNTKKQGVISNFENALNHVTGDFIFLSDQDDIWKPDKVKVCLDYLRKFDIVVSDCDIIDENDNVIFQSYFSRRKSGKGFLKNVWANTYLGCCLAFDKKLLKIALPFPRDITMHDIWFGFVGEVLFESFFIKQPLVSYRNHTKNVSPTTVGISPYGLGDKFVFRWNILKYLPLLIFRKWKV